MKAEALVVLRKLLGSTPIRDNRFRVMSVKRTTALCEMRCCTITSSVATKAYR